MSLCAKLDAFFQLVTMFSLSHLTTTIWQYYEAWCTNVMTQMDPEGLGSQGKVGQKKRHRGLTGTFTSLVRYLFVPFFTDSRKTHDHVARV